MNDEYVFLPEQRLGAAFHVVVMILFAGAAGLGVFRAANASIGPVFLFYLLPSLLAVIAIPVLAYRTYALLTGSYALEREGLRLRWGLRIEEIPMTAVLWVHPAAELAVRIPLPWLRWPGSVMGVRQSPGTGEIEFMAAHSGGLVLIGTQGRTYAISPANPQDFLLAFERCTEMGSLMPLAPRSVYPSLLVSRFWSIGPARALVLAGLVLSVILLVLVSLVIPGRSSVPLGFEPGGAPGEPAPSVRLLLLPVVNAFFFLSDFFLGLFFFRRQETQNLSYILWSAGVLTPLFFLMAIFFILRV
ncbi:MAG: hypothetical protein JXB15_14970 [Anaerolineales bacterium]|nr:hypothetical protein [Anaerolineales bacterium]